MLHHCIQLMRFRFRLCRDCNDSGIANQTARWTPENERRAQCRPHYGHADDRVHAQVGGDGPTSPRSALHRDLRPLGKTPNEPGVGLGTGEGNVAPECESVSLSPYVRSG